MLTGAKIVGHQALRCHQCYYVLRVPLCCALPPGEFLWELIYPRDPKDNTHVKPPNGKYRVKLFIMVSAGKRIFIFGQCGHCRSHIPIFTVMPPLDDLMGSES